MKSNKEGTIPRDSIRAIKRLQPVVASNDLTTCFKTFSKNSTKDGGYFCLESSVINLGSRDEMIDDLDRERMICFKIPYDEKYHARMTAHTFQNFICD